MATSLPCNSCFSAKRIKDLRPSTPALEIDANCFESFLLNRDSTDRILWQDAALKTLPAVDHLRQQLVKVFGWICHVCCRCVQLITMHLWIWKQELKNQLQLWEPSVWIITGTLLSLPANHSGTTTRETASIDIIAVLPGMTHRFKKKLDSSALSAKVFGHGV